MEDVTVAVELLNQLAEHAAGEQGLSDKLRLAARALEKAGATGDASSLLALLVT